MTESHVTQQELRDSEQRTNNRIDSLTESIEKMSDTVGGQIGKIYSALSHNKEDFLRDGGKFAMSAFGLFVVLFGLIVFFANIIQENIELRGEISIIKSEKEQVMVNKSQDLRIAKMEAFIEERHKLSDNRF